MMSFLPSVALMGAQLDGSSAEATGTTGKASRIVLLTCRFRTLSSLAKGLFQCAANLPAWGHRGPRLLPVALYVLLSKTKEQANRGQNAGSDSIGWTSSFLFSTKVNISCCPVIQEDRGIHGMEKEPQRYPACPARAWSSASSRSSVSPPWKSSWKACVC